MEEIKGPISAEQFVKILTTSNKFPEGVTRVDGAVILHNEEIECGRFEGIEFAGRLDLSGCRFKRGFRFRGNKFVSPDPGKGASISGTSSGLVLSGATFHGKLDVADCQFSRLALPLINLTTKDSPTPLELETSLSGMDLRDIVVHGGVSIAGSSDSGLADWTLLMDGACIDGSAAIKLPAASVATYLLASNMKVGFELRVDCRDNDWIWLRNVSIGKDAFITVLQGATKGGGKINVTGVNVSGDLKVCSDNGSMDVSAPLDWVDFRSAKVDGDIVIRPKGRPKSAASSAGPLVISEIKGANASAGGDVDLSTIILKSSAQQARDCFVDLTSVSSGKSLKFHDIKCSPYRAKVEKEEGRPEAMIICRDCSVNEQLLFSEISPACNETDEFPWLVIVDAYGAKATLIELSGIKTAQSKVDIRAVTVSQLISVNSTQVKCLDLRYSKSTALRVEDSTIGAKWEPSSIEEYSCVDASSIELKAYFKVLGCSIFNINVKQAKISGDLILDRITVIPAEVLGSGGGAKASVDASAIDLTGSFRISSSLVGDVDFKQARVRGDVIFEAVAFGNLDLSNSILAGKLSLDGSEGLRIERVGSPADAEFVNDKSFERNEFNKVVRLERMAGLARRRLITTGNVVVFDSIEANSIDLRGCFFFGSPSSGSAKNGGIEPKNKRFDFVSGVGARVHGELRLRSSQFLCEHPHINVASDEAAKDKVRRLVSRVLGRKRIGCKHARTPLADLSESDIGELDLASPLPSPINLTDSVVRRWGLIPPDADNYIEVLKCTGELDIPHYLRVEEMFENSGKREEADKIHRSWQDRQRQLFLERGQRFRFGRAWLHGETLGYGTERWRMMLIIFTLWALSAMLFGWNQDEWLQPDTSAQSALVQCQGNCGEFPIKKPIEYGRLERVLNPMMFSFRHNIPLVDFALVPALEARPGTPAPYLVFLFRVLGWITWPVLLASVIPSIFPKRYRS